MSDASSSGSSSSSQSSAHLYEDESVLTWPCHWSWCRELLPSKEAMIHHVIDHIMLHAVPVRRKDVNLMRKIEEGTQQSLRISLLKDSLPGVGAISQEDAEMSMSQQAHNKSLPSPPHSNGMLHTPASEAGVLPPRDAPSSSSGSSDSSGSESEQNQAYASPAKSYPRGSAAATPNGMRHNGNGRNATPTFASLNSPTNSQASQASRVVSQSIPNSPSFSSMVKRKAEGDHTPRLSRFNPLSQSRLSTGSTGSQMSVEKQLTQSPHSDIESEASPGREQALADSFSPPGLDNDVTMSQSLYTEELAWARAGASGGDVFLSQAAQEPMDFELLTQPPSQLQLGTFPFHSHRKSQNFGASQAEPGSSMPFRPSPPVLVTEKEFAASTPQPQQTRRQTRSQSRGPEPAPVPVPAKAKNTPVRRTAAKPAASGSKTPKPKTAKPRSRSFRSGTLQITPLAQTPSQPATIAEETSQQLQQGLTAEELLDMNDPLRNYNGSPSRSQSTYESMDFGELQTQAPYESQPMTQY